MAATTRPEKPAEGAIAGAAVRVRPTASSRAWYSARQVAQPARWVLSRSCSGGSISLQGQRDQQVVGEVLGHGSTSRLAAS